jgi:CRP-like cAMP-binding protein
MTGFGTAADGVRHRAESTFAGLGEARGLDPKRVQSFWRNVERYVAGGTVRANATAVRRLIVVSGWACETRILRDGRRQIFAFVLPGDAIDVQAASNIGQRAVVALTRLEIVDSAVVASGDSAEAISASRAIERAIRQREDRLFDQMVRIGRLTAKERVLNMLLELHDRLDAVGMVKDHTFRMPITQEMFADALGLSIVHINRTLQQLRREGLIVLKAGSLTLQHRDRLALAACYPFAWNGREGLGEAVGC